MKSFANTQKTIQFSNPDDVEICDLDRGQVLSDDYHDEIRQFQIEEQKIQEEKEKA